MAASVRIEDEAFSEPRIELLGTICGYNRYEALGRMAHLWRICTNRHAYIVSEAMVTATLGERGVDGIIGSELGERTEGGIRVRGTAGRIEWLQTLRASSKAGGLANASRLASKRKPNGSNSKPNGSQSEPNGSQTEAKAEPHPSVPTPTLTLKEDVRQAPLPLVPEPSAPTRRVTDAFNERYLTAYGTKPTWDGRNGKAIKALLKSHPADEVVRRIGILFDAPPTWLVEPYDFSTFVQHFDKLVQPTKQTANGRPAEPPRTNLPQL